MANLFDLDRLVIDKTDVKDRFVIHLELDTDPSGAPAAAVVKALETRLGLTLVSTTGRRPWVQIEHIERPNLRQTRSLRSLATVGRPSFSPRPWRGET